MRIYQSVISAAQVVLSGFSAGAFGTEANCDLLADSLHAIKPDIGVRCIVDSGSIYPLNTHRCLHTIYSISTHYLLDIYTLSTQYLRSAECATQDLLLSWFQSWEGINDESCLAEHPAGERGCVR